jgi:hypothetical protein
MFLMFIIIIRVELPIIEHVPITKHFSIFFSFINQNRVIFMSLDVQIGELQMFFECQK